MAGRLCPREGSRVLNQSWQVAVGRCPSPYSALAWGRGPGALGAVPVFSRPGADEQTASHVCPKPGPGQSVLQVEPKQTQGQGTPSLPGVPKGSAELSWP